MEMMEAMQKCAPGGYVARKAYPNRKYYKSCSGLFYKAAGVDRIDFIATDWECHSGRSSNHSRIESMA